MKQLIVGKRFKKNCRRVPKLVAEQGVKLVVTLDAIAIAKLVSLSEAAVRTR